jgi:cyclase
MLGGGMELRPLARGVYACLQPDNGLGTSNSGLIDRGGGLVVDTFWDLPHTRRLIATYERVRRDPVGCVVNTHHNGDHCWGNQLFPGAEIIGHRNCAAAFGRERPEAMQALRSGAGSGDPTLETFARLLADWDFSGIVLAPPTTLVDDRLVLDLDGIAVHLVYVGPAHTSGDLIVHLPAERIVFAGDVLFRLCTPIGWDGTTARWIEALDEIVALAPDVIVPGHGPLCGIEGAREMQAYLGYVESEAKRFHAAGLTPLDAARRLDLGPYATWTEPERVLFQIERVYRELRGEPYDAPLPVTELFRDMITLRRERRGDA